MAEQQRQMQQLTNRRHRKRLSRRLLLILIIGIAFVIIVLWTLSSIGVISGTWATILSVIVAVSGVVAALLPLLLSSDNSESSSTGTSVTTAPQIGTSTLLDQTSSTSMNKTPYRGIVGFPPPIDPGTIQQREKSVKDIYMMLNKSEVTAIALAGIGGVGKSTLAGLVYQYAEGQRKAGIGLFTAAAIWLRIDPAVTMADLVGTLFEALGKSLPDLSILSPHSQAVLLLNAMNSVDKARLVVLDQFENLLDGHTGQPLPDQPGIGEWIDAINSQKCVCRILLTSRLLPQGTSKYPLTYMQEYHTEGLTQAEGIELLQKQGVKATAADLSAAVARCAGHAFALTLLASLLRFHKLSLSNLTEDSRFAHLWTGDIARNLLDSIYSRLNDVQRKLLGAFSIYREPVLLEAALAIIDDAFDRTQIESAIDALLLQHLLQATGDGRYQIHAIVATFAQQHFVHVDESANKEALEFAHSKCAQYYLQQAAMKCPPIEQRRQISDVHDLIEAIWHLCQAEQWQQAYNLLRKEWIFPHLNLWGNNATLLELYTLLLPSDRWKPDDTQTALIYNNLGLACRDLGKIKQAQEYFEQALILRKRVGDRKGEGATLNHLGRLFAEQGEKERAKEYLEQALQIRIEIGDRQGEVTTLNNLGSIDSEQGENKRAIAYFEQALGILKEESNPRMKSKTLNNLGKVCAELGDAEQAQLYLEESLRIRREIGYRGGEGRTLRNLGSVYKSLGAIKPALKCYKEALIIFRELGDIEEEGTTFFEIGMLFFENERSDDALACFLLAKERFEEVQSSKQNIIQKQIGILRSKLGDEHFNSLVTRLEPDANGVMERALRDVENGKPTG